MTGLINLMEETVLILDFSLAFYFSRTLMYVIILFA